VFGDPPPRVPSRCFGAHPRPGFPRLPRDLVRGGREAGGGGAERRDPEEQREVHLRHRGRDPTRDNGIYCKIAGRTATDLVTDIGLKAGAIIAIGSCAAWGGIPSAAPIPPGDGGPPVPEEREQRPVPQREGHRGLRGVPPTRTRSWARSCSTPPTNPARPRQPRAAAFAYARTIHEDCPRRPHFDAGRFAERFGDEGHRHGYCLYKTGCKGPGPTPLLPAAFRRGRGAWPVGIGHPCFGCTEQSLAFRVPLHTTVEIDRPTPRTPILPSTRTTAA